MFDKGRLGLPGDCNASEYFCILILVMLQAGMLLSHEVATSALTEPDVKSRFVSWVSAECLDISQKKNRVALYNSFLLKSGGATQSALVHMRKSCGYSFNCGSLLCLGDWFIHLLLIVAFEKSLLHLALPLGTLLMRMLIRDYTGLIIMRNRMLPTPSSLRKSNFAACFGLPTQ